MHTNRIFNYLAQCTCKHRTKDKYANCVHENTNMHRILTGEIMLKWPCETAMHVNAFLPPPYRFSEFRDSNTVGEGIAVTSVVHQNTRKEHWTQVIPIQNVHSQSCCSSSSVGGVWSAVLEDDQMASVSVFKLRDNLCIGATHSLT